MKTAKEWAQSIPLYKDNKNFIEFIKKIQLDAWKQGMSDAAHFCRNKRLILEGETIADAILTARDNKTTI